MKINNYIVGLDVGTTKIVTMIAQKDAYGKIDIIGVGKSKSMGVMRGVVSNIKLTVDSIQTAVEEAQEVSGEQIKEVVVGIAGQHVRSLQHSDYIIRENPNTIITQSELKQLNEQAYKLTLNEGEQIIGMVAQEYKVDGQSDIIEPIGMYGSRIEANFHVAVGQTSSIKNIKDCIEMAGLKLAGMDLEPIASSESVLTQEEKEAGVALIDIGGGTTDLAIFKDGKLRHTAVIPFGGNVITNDIKEGLGIIERHAEKVKLDYGSALPEMVSTNEIITIPGLKGHPHKEIGMKALSGIINARVIEIFGQVLSEIKNYGYGDNKKKLIGGIIITGGGSQLKHLVQLVEYQSGMSTRIGKPNEYISGTGSKEITNPIYATSVGLSMFAADFQNNRDQENKKTIVENTIREPKQQQPSSDKNITQEEEKIEQKTHKKQSLIASAFDNLRKFLEKVE